MGLITASKNAALNALTIDKLSLHSDYPGTDGGSNELSGGTPAYARKAATVNTASGAARALNADVAFDVPPGADVAAIGFWQSGTPDTFVGWAPNGPTGNHAKAGFVDSATDQVRLDGHGLADADRVFFYPTPGGSVPAGLSEGTLYYVVGSAASYFQVALTSGGAAVDITADGGLLFQKASVESFTEQGTHTVKAGTLVEM